MSKDQPRQRTVGKCGHNILPIQREGVMLWYCYDCSDYAEKSHVKLQPRGKSK